MVRNLLFLIAMVCAAAYSPQINGQWGLLGKLGKLGSKVDAPELKKIDLPDNHKGRDSKQLTPTSDGDWLVSLEDGRRISLSAAADQGVDLSNSILVLRTLDIPKDINQFQKLPGEVPVYISGFNNQLFQLSQVAGKFRLKYKNVAINVSSSSQANNAIYQLNRAMLNGNSRYLNITNDSADILPKNRLSSNAMVEDVSEQSVLQALGQLRYDSVVLSGAINNGRLFTKGSQQGLPVAELKRVAAERNLSLVILETDKPLNLLKKLVKKDTKNDNSLSSSGVNTAEFFSRIATQNGDDVLELSLSNTGQLQVGLQLKKKPTPSRSSARPAATDNDPDSSVLGADVSVYTFASLVKGASVYRAASDPKDEGLSFGIVTQLILSLLLGLLVLQTSNRAWAFIWSGPSQERRANSFRSRLVFGLNRLVFFVVFLPLFGFFIAVYVAIAKFVSLLWRIISSPFRLLIWLLELVGLKAKRVNQVGKTNQSSENLEDTIENALVYDGGRTGDGGRYIVMQSDIGYPASLAQSASKMRDLSIAELTDLAYQQNYDACNELGCRYAHGKHVTQNDKQALQWFSKAADEGHALAQNNMAVMYRYGKAVQQSWPRAHELYQLSADQKCADALNALGWMYRMGRGASLDYDKAIALFREAVKLEHGMAMFNLGNMLLEGMGTKKDHAEALRMYKRGAKLKNAQATTAAGMVYECSEYVPNDWGKAVEYYREGAELGSSKAMYDLGTMYENGKHVELDKVRAIKWYRKAAEAGYPYAQFELGYAYENGEVLEQDYKQALHWYQLAADWGDSFSICHLGNMHRKGRGVPKNLLIAHDFYRDAATEGNAVAMYNLGELYSNNEYEDRSPETAFYWYLKSAKAGHLYAAFSVAELYADGEGTEKSKEKALQWYLSAAERGHAFSQYLLGFNYRWGHSVKQNYPLAEKWYLKAAKNGNKAAMYQVAVMYNDGEGLTVNYQKALEWFLKAADAGETDSYNYIANLYYHGNGVKRDYSEALKWLHKAAEAKDATAINNLGVIYREGKGVTRDYERAFEYFRQAAQLNEENAMGNLAYMYEAGLGISKDIETAKMWRQRAEAQG